MEFENKVIDESMQGTAIELQNQGGEGKKKNRRVEFEFI
jgi:hypothetical protein